MVSGPTWGFESCPSPKKGAEVETQNCSFCLGLGELIGPSGEGGGRASLLTSLGPRILPYPSVQGQALSHQLQPAAPEPRMGVA